MEHVVLVDEKDRSLGTMEKMEAHEKGVLHRAFSVFLFNKRGDVLLQKRSKEKYHSGGLWTNTCCSHPRSEETVVQAGERRLIEEMGIQAKVEEVFTFTYKAELDKGLTEHEFDHVLFGLFQGEINLNPDEVEDYKYISKEDLLKEVSLKPENFTEWFKIALPKVASYWPSEDNKWKK